MKSTLCILRQSSESLTLIRTYPGKANQWIRYFFCHEVGSSLDVTQYTLSLAKTCITYLCQSHHDPDIDESQLETHMLNGVYRLHHYATGAWIQLLVLYCQTKKTDKASPEWSQLLDLLHRVLDRRVNADYTPDNVEANFPSLKSLKNKYPKVYTLLCREAHFHQQSESTMFKLGTGKTPFSYRCYQCQTTLCYAGRHQTNILCQTTGTHRTPQHYTTSQRLFTGPSTRWLTCQPSPRITHNMLTIPIFMPFDATMALDPSSAHSWAAHIIGSALRPRPFA